MFRNSQIKIHISIRLCSIVCSCRFNVIYCDSLKYSPKWYTSPYRCVYKAWVWNMLQFVWISLDLTLKYCFFHRIDICRFKCMHQRTESEQKQNPNAGPERWLGNRNGRVRNEYNNGAISLHDPHQCTENGNGQSHDGRSEKGQPTGVRAA